MWTCDDLGKRVGAGAGNSLHKSWMIRAEVGKNITDAGLFHHVNNARISGGPVHGAPVHSDYLL